MGVVTNVYSRKNIGKNQKKEVCEFFKIRVQELFTHGEGISTLHAHHKGQQPLTKYVKHDFKITYFSFLYLFIFGVDKRGALAPMYPRVR